jgi:hypothetical protein
MVDGFQHGAEPRIARRWVVRAQDAADAAHQPILLAPMNSIISMSSVSRDTLLPPTAHLAQQNFVKVCRSASRIGNLRWGEEFQRHGTDLAHCGIALNLTLAG